MKSRDTLKMAAAKAALSFVPDRQYIGIGSGSTVDIFIQELAKSGKPVAGCVPASDSTRDGLLKAGLKIVDLGTGYPLGFYFDGADEINSEGVMIKGGGGALTREKIIAASSETFICMVDESKVVDSLGHFPLAVEVIAMATKHVSAEIKKMGGQPTERQNFETDNGNIILDIEGLDLTKASKVESDINNIAGIVSNGLFSFCRCSQAIIGTEGGVDFKVFQKN